MPDSFGARLRERREQQQVALSTIAEQTKIKVSLLEALERDDVSHWPSGIFRRAFIRAYAHAIGLEPDVIVREFLELYPDPIEIVDTLQAGAPGAEGAWVSDGPPTRFRHMVASAIGSVSRLRSRGSQRPGSVFDGSLAPAHAAHSNGSSHHATNVRDDISNLPAIRSRMPDPGCRIADAMPMASTGIDRSGRRSSRGSRRRAESRHRAKSKHGATCGRRAGATDRLRPVACGDRRRTAAIDCGAIRG
jgi:transcriptional regulator with XRE-family HTH domain